MRTAPMLASAVPSIRRVLALVLAAMLTTSGALAQESPPIEINPAPATPAEPEPTPETEPAPTPEVEPTPEPEPERSIPTQQILPSSRQTAPEPPEPDPELTEDFVLPAPEPEWRLRAGIGASASTSGTDVLALRLTQEIEWMPAAAAPFLFGITGGELIGVQNIYLAGVRLGGWARFCEDRLVICSGAIALRAGASFGGFGGTQFDLGGDADARFRFDGVELTVRVGFFLVDSTTHVDALGLLGAAF